MVGPDELWREGHIETLQNGPRRTLKAHVPTHCASARADKLARCANPKSSSLCGIGLPAVSASLQLEACLRHARPYNIGGGFSGA